MEQVGDELAGFSVGPVDGQIRVRAWGFWSADVADLFPKQVMAALHTNRRGVPLTMDATALKPMRTEGQIALRDVLVQACGLGSAIKIITESPLVKLQLLRIVRDAGKELPVSVMDVPKRGAEEKQG